MIKNFKFAGVALLVVGLTFAASSCQKQDFIENQDENQVVDLNELTKAPVAEVAEATANVEAALADFFSSASKEDVINVIEDGQIAKRISSFFSSFKGEYILDIDKEFFSSLFRVGIALSSDNTYRVTVSRTRGYINIQTPKGYFIKAYLPDVCFQFPTTIDKYATAELITRGDELLRSNYWKLVIGKDETKYGEVIFDIIRSSNIYTNLYDKNNNENPVAGTIIAYNHKTYKAISFKFWYNNTYSGNGDTDFMINDFSEVFNALKDMTTITSPYTEAEANEIAAQFNNNFTNCAGDNVAWFKGKPFMAVPEATKSVSEIYYYRVNLQWGDAFVSALDIYEFLKKYFKSIIDGDYSTEEAEPAARKEAQEVPSSSEQ